MLQLISFSQKPGKSGCYSCHPHSTDDMECVSNLLKWVLTLVFQLNLVRTRAIRRKVQGTSWTLREQWYKLNPHCGRSQTIRSHWLFLSRDMSKEILERCVISTWVLDLEDKPISQRNWPGNSYNNQGYCRSGNMQLWRKMGNCYCAVQSSRS